MYNNVKSKCICIDIRWMCNSIIRSTTEYLEYEVVQSTGGTPYSCMGCDTAKLHSVRSTMCFLDGF
jgi:hypothetical protein